MNFKASNFVNGFHRSRKQLNYLFVTEYTTQFRHKRVKSTGAVEYINYNAPPVSAREILHNKNIVSKYFRYFFAETDFDSHNAFIRNGRRPVL